MAKTKGNTQTAPQYGKEYSPRQIEKMIMASERKDSMDQDGEYVPHNPQLKIRKPRALCKPVVASDSDCFEVSNHRSDPRRRRSFPSFCRDFIGQNYGAIAQDLLQLHGSPNPQDKIQFLRFIMEMGKMGYPASQQLDTDGAKSASRDIYAQLERMSTTGIAPEIGKESEAMEEQNADGEAEDGEMSAQSEQRAEDYAIEEVETEVLDNAGYEESEDYDDDGNDLLAQFERFTDR